MEIVMKIKEKKQTKTKTKVNVNEIFNQKTFLTIVAVGVVVLLMVYVLVYMDYSERTQEVTASNASVQATIDELQVYADNLPQYESAISDMEAQINERLSEYPADAREEDIIMLAVGLQNKSNITYSTIGMEESEVVYEIPSTVAKQVEMEGYDSDIDFVRKHANLVNVTDYSNLKTIVEQIFASSNRIGIDSISYSKNDTDATLEGSISLYLYSATGTGKEYESPNMTTYRAGTTDMFKTGSLYRSITESDIEDEQEDAGETSR
jgi:Tfp pilus assembly protein PilO